MSATTGKATTARKIIGSLGVLGAAAAVAGLGTFGTFTDSTTPIAANLDSGTVDINLAIPGNAMVLPAGDFLPGDSLTRAIDLSNDGTAPLSTVVLGITAPASSLLDTDTTHGLQLTVRSCSVPWTQGGAPAAPSYTCAGTRTTIVTEPVVGDHDLPGLDSLAPGGTDHLTVTISLPDTAGNTFQGKTTTLSLMLTGTQRAGTTR